MKRIAVSLLLAGMVACQADQMLPSPPNALIRDAGHGGGNFFFAFLQPMVSQPTRNGVFDATQSPTVKVALLSGDASCTDPHLTYTMSTGPGGDASETVRVNATDGNYIVNLHTDKVAVTSGCTYRVHVFIGLIELGFADIQLFLTQGAAKNLTDNTTVGLVDGKTLPIKFWIAQGVLRDVGQGTASPDHETVIVTQNLKAGVLIPAGAVSAPTTILIESVDDRPCFPGLVGQSFQGLPGATENSCYRFRTDPPLPGGKFINNKQAIVGICVDLSQVTPAQKPKIQIFQFDAGLPDQTPDRIKPLPDAPAPFLPCDPAFPGGIGLGKHGILDYAAHLFTSLFSPKPAFARSRAVVFDLGAGGSTDGFSLFTWGLVTDMAKNAGDLQTAVVGTAVATPPSVMFKDSTGALVDSVPVTFTPGPGSGSVTGGFTKSGRGGVSGVAQVGSWTLGSTGANTLVASAPAFSGVTPTSVTFTATGLAAIPGGLYLIRDTDGMLRRLDPNTLSFTDIGLLGVVYGFGDCAWNSTNNTLYMVDARGAKSLYTVSLTTGAATAVGVHGVTDMFAIGYYPPTNSLYGASGDGNFYQLDLTTGAATLIGNTGLVPSGTTGGSVNGLTWDSARNQFVALVSNVGGGALYSVNVTTAGVTSLATSPGIDNAGLTYVAADDRLWAADYTGGIFQYDPTAGYLRTTILSGTGRHTCIAYVP